MKINEVITESKAKPKKLKENSEVAELGRAMMDMAARHKDDDVSNELSTLGDALTRFGTNLGPKSIKDVVKQTGLDTSKIQKYMQAAQQYLEKHGPVRSGVSDMDDDNFDDEKEGFVHEEGEPNVKRLWMQINKYEQQAKKTKSPIKKDHFMKMADELRDKLPTDEE